MKNPSTKKVQRKNERYVTFDFKKRCKFKCNVWTLFGFQFKQTNYHKLIRQTGKV